MATLFRPTPNPKKNLLTIVMSNSQVLQKGSGQIGFLSRRFEPQRVYGYCKRSELFGDAQRSETLRRHLVDDAEAGLYVLLEKQFNFLLKFENMKIAYLFHEPAYA